jgi:hypothetical protein
MLVATSAIGRLFAGANINFACISRRADPISTENLGNFPVQYGIQALDGEVTGMP